MPEHDIIVVGASAGGVEALVKVVRGLPSDLPGAVFVVLHVPPYATSALPRILNSAGPLPAVHAVDGEPIERGRIYVAPPDYHLLVDLGRVRVTRGPRENRHRPAVDPLFRSAARSYGPRTVGVVLTGALDDGTAGLLAIKKRGGVAIVQDPDEALFSGMPAGALEYVDVDECLSLRDIAPALARISREPADEEGGHPVSEELEIESKIAVLDETALEREYSFGQLAGFACPDCKGPLWEIHDGELLRFRCRTGHAFTAEGLVAGQSEALEEALYMALNTLEESRLMAERLAAEAHGRDHGRVAQRFEYRARDAQRRAEVIRQALLGEDAAASSDVTAAQAPAESRSVAG